MYAMYRCLSSFLLLFICAAALAQKPQPPSRDVLAAIAARGLEPDECETYSNGVRKALYRDPDGNELGFGGAPLDTGS